jgi:hypothetical protein
MYNPADCKVVPLNCDEGEQPFSGMAIRGFHSFNTENFPRFYWRHIDKIQRHEKYYYHSTSCSSPVRAAHWGLTVREHMIQMRRPKIFRLHRSISLKTLFRHRVSRPKCGILFPERNYASQISPPESLFKVVPITCHHTFALCNLVVTNVQSQFR